MVECVLPPGVELHPLRPLSDARGSLLKVLMAPQLPQPARFGEIYLTTALRGATRGLHYHERTHEWFCVVAGSFRAWLQELDPTRGPVCALELSADEPCLLHVPPRVAHAFENHASERALLLAYADRPYDPRETDTFAHAFPVGEG